MSLLSIAAAAEPLDEFLEGAGASTRLAERLETIGLVLALPGIVVTIGLLAFVLFVHRGNQRETRFLLRSIGWSGLVVMLGGLVELVGTMTILSGGILDKLTDATTRGASFRVMGGVLMAIGYMGARVDDPGLSRPWRENLGTVGVTLGAISFSIDGHTISEGNPVLHAGLSVIHVLAAGIWVGGAVALLYVVRARRRTESESVAPLVVRFSSVATLALVSVAAAGLGMSFLIIDSVDEYVTTTWGRLLLIKVGLVSVAASLGAYNHFVVVPKLDHDPADRETLARAGAALSAEAIVLVAVALMTVFLTGASTN